MPEQNTEWMDHVSIKVDGSLLKPKVMNYLLDVIVDTSLYMPAMFIMRFHDENLEVVDDGPFKLGAAVEIEMALGNTEFKRLIAGEITAIEPVFDENLTSILTIRGYDRSHRLNRGNQSRVYVQMSDKDIVEQIAKEAHLKANVDATPGTYDHVFQYNQTDLTFLQERAKRIGYEVFVEDKQLYFRKPKGKRGEVQLEWGVTMRRFQPRLTLSHQVNEVIVKGWDPVAKREVIGNATESDLAAAIGMDGDGGELASKAFSPAKQIVVRQPVTSQREAEAIAQSVLDEINAEFVEAEGIAWGNPQILAGTKIKITKVGQRFSGSYLVTSASHVYAPEGYEVYFRVEGARPKLISDLIQETNTSEASSNTWGGVVPAIVTNNNDPKGMGRVKVKFPWIDVDLESNWARVAAVGAGNDRGLFWLPEVNDEVLVAFEHGDFNQPYVVGNLWNGKDKPPEAISDAVKNGKVEVRTLKTREGHTIRLVDDQSEQVIEIVDAGECNRIKLDVTSKKLTISTQGDLEIDSAQKITVKANADINVEGAANVKIKGSSNVNIESDTQLALKGSVISVQATGQLTLKGATVNIN